MSEPLMPDAMWEARDSATKPVYAQWGLVYVGDAIRLLAAAVRDAAQALRENSHATR